jgi:enamine deaminase RidA (YjgF/YER057c/UK114 family)
MSADAAEQTLKCFANIEGALAAVGAELADVVRSRVFIGNPADAAAVMARVAEKFAGINPASTVLCTPLGGPDYKVEIEVTAYKGAGRAAVNSIRITL